MPASGTRSDRGATAVELAFITPIVLIVIMLVVQFALWFHGRQVADAAAREGARIARSAGTSAVGWRTQAEQKATGIVRDVGPRLLRGATASAWEEGDNRGVTVQGDAVQVIPLLPPIAFTITADFGGPIECFRPDVDGGTACE